MPQAAALALPALVAASLDDKGVRLSKPGNGSITVPYGQLEGERVATRVWKDACNAVDQGQEVSEWLTDALASKTPLRLLTMEPGFTRPLHKAPLLGEETTTDFADAAPFLVANEASAGFMADVCYRLTGTPALCHGTFGPGATNLITGIANAYVDKLPVIAITGEVPTYAFGKGGLQESSGEGGTVDQAALFSGVARYHKLIERTDYLATVLNEAARHLRAEIPGPVVISIPYNVQKELVDETILDQLPLRAPTHPPAAKIHRPLLKEIVELLKQAESPLIVAGYGCIRSSAQKILKQFCERLNIPVATSLKAAGNAVGFRTKRPVVELLGTCANCADKRA